MPRDTQLLTARNRELRADFCRLKAEEHRFKVNGRICYVRLNSDQVIQVLSKLYHLSARRVEVLVYDMEPRPVALNTAAA